MQEKQNTTDVFDFDAAVAEARADYPEETKNVTFINLDAADAKKQVIDWIMNTNPGLARMEAFLQKMLQAEADPENPSDGVKDILRMHKGTLAIIELQAESIVNSNGVCNIDGHSSMLACRSKLSADHNWSGICHSDNAWLWYAFNHELGHILVPNGRINILVCTREEADHDILKVMNKCENAADGFSILRGLKKGQLSIADAANISDGRIKCLISDTGPGHFTTVMLDQICFDMKDGDLTSLSPRDIVELAQKYSEDYALGNLKALVQDLGVKGRTSELWLENLADVCRKAPDDTVQFHIAARVLSGVLDGNDLMWPAELEKIVPSGGKWDLLHREVAPRLKNAGAAIRMNQPGRLQ